MAKVTINTKPVAGNYTGMGERIIEFSHPLGGGLISFTVDEDSGTVRVDVYRQDASVQVRVGKPDEARTPEEGTTPDV